MSEISLDATIEEELGQFSPDDREKLMDARIYSEVSDNVYAATGVRAFTASGRASAEGEPLRTIVQQSVRKLANQVLG